MSDPNLAEPVTQHPSSRSMFHAENFIQAYRLQQEMFLNSTPTRSKEANEDEINKKKQIAAQISE